MIFQTKAEESKPEAGSWRVRGGPIWPNEIKEDLIFVPDFQLGFLAVVPESEFSDSDVSQSITDLQETIESSDSDPAELRQLQRIAAASRLTAKLSGGKLAIPREIVWLLRRGNEQDRDLTLVRRGAVVEIWPSSRWQEYLAGHLLKPTSGP